MAISLQLVEVPANEQVSNRQVTLPDSGGTIGRGFDCTLQLPDFSRQLSRVHVEITPVAAGGYQIIDHSTNGVMLNGRKLMKQLPQRLCDGDVIKLPGYVLLVSDATALFAEKDTKNSAKEALAEADNKGCEPVFSTDSLDVEDLGYPRDAFEEVSEAGINQSRQLFSRDNVLNDDRFGHDPFDDLDLGQAQDSTESSQQKSSQQQSRTGELVLDNPNPSEVEQIKLAMQESIQQLHDLIELQRSPLASYGDSRLLACLERSLDRFLEEFSPEFLEHSFDDFTSNDTGMRRWRNQGQKDKHYWQFYCKQFQQKQARGEFHRQFTALFLEELRGKG